MKLSDRNTIYISVAVLFGLSGLVYILLPHEEFVRKYAGIPLVSSLIVALFQVVRDILNNERALYLISEEQKFTLGASSHMAQIAFDKHVEFCELYMEETYSCLDTLFRESPTRIAIDHANTLNGIRKKYCTWLTRNIDLTLEKFETTLRKIGSAAYIIERGAHDDAKTERINQMYMDFANVLGKEHLGEDSWAGTELTRDVAIQNIMGVFRKILGTEELVEIRSEIIKKALMAARNG